MTDDRLSPIVDSAFNHLTSIASASAYFEGGVLSHEPKSAPQSAGMTFSCFGSKLRPVARESGLSVTTMVLDLTVRMYRNMLADPQDRIDPELCQASAYLLASLTEDCAIDGAEIDLLGRHGTALAANLGYIALDGTMFRVSEAVVSFVAYDVFDQER